MPDREPVQDTLAREDEARFRSDNIGDEDHPVVLEGPDQHDLWQVIAHCPSDAVAQRLADALNVASSLPVQEDAGYGITRPGGVATMRLTAAVLGAIEAGLTPERIREIVEEDLPPAPVQDGEGRAHEELRIVGRLGEPTPTSVVPHGVPRDGLSTWDEFAPTHAPHRRQRRTVTEWVDVPAQREGGSA